MVKLIKKLIKAEAGVELIRKLTKIKIEVEIGEEDSTGNRLKSYLD